MEVDGSVCQEGLREWLTTEKMTGPEPSDTYALSSTLVMESGQEQIVVWN